MDELINFHSECMLEKRACLFLTLMILVLFFYTPTLVAQTEEVKTQTEANTTSASKNKKEEIGVKLRDIARVSGVRSNQLLGYGLVVGLPGTGDTKTRLASESIQNLLGNLGQRIDAPSTQARNVAAVLVTAELPPYIRKGDRLNVTVSSIADAKSIEGGVLVQTPLYAGNREVYAVAQGVLTTGGKDPNARVVASKTVGTVLNGAQVEREINLNYFTEDRKLRIHLNDFSFSTLNEVRNAILKKDSSTKLSADGGSIIIEIPTDKDPLSYIAWLESIDVAPSRYARVVINERTGTIVMGGDVYVSPVAVSRGGVELRIHGNNRDREAARMGIYVSAVNQKDNKGEEKKLETTQEFKGATVAEIVRALNTMGASIQDIIAILEALKEAGALYAQVIVH